MARERTVYVLATGARTPLGIGSARSAAAVRAGISAMTERALLVDRPWTLRQVALDPELNLRLTGTDRLLSLAAEACSEASEPLERWQKHDRKLAVFLGLPEYRPGFAEPDVQVFRTHLARFDALAGAETHLFPEGHAAGLLAITIAVDRIRHGAFDLCLIGGVDSYFHSATLEWLDGNRQLAGGGARSAFVPGEAAGFCLLGSERAQEWLGIRPFMRIVSVATGRETRLIKTEEVCLGEGLTQTIQSAAAALTENGAIECIICDLNGERYRAEEWGFVCLRMARYFTDPTGYLSPADCWGDVGAASGPLFMMLACEGAKRGYSNARRIMLWAGSEAGLRAAAVLESATPVRE